MGLRLARCLNGEPRHPRGCDAAPFDEGADLPVRSPRTVSSPSLPPRTALVRATISPPAALPHKRSFEARAHLACHVEFSP